jgi:hypothetical protein
LAKRSDWPIETIALDVFSFDHQKNNKKFEVHKNWTREKQQWIPFLELKIQALPILGILKNSCNNLDCEAYSSSMEGSIPEGNASEA